MASISGNYYGALLLLRLNGGQGNGEHNVIDQRAARQVIHRLVQALQHRADADYTGCALHSFISGVAGVQVRENKYIGAAGDFGVRRLRAADAFHRSRVILQRAVNQQVRAACLS